MAQQLRRPQLVLNRPRTNEANFAPHQPSTRLNDQSPGALVVAARDPMGATQLALETLPTKLVEACLPFEQPGATATDPLDNGARLDALQDQANRAAAEMALFLLVHAASFAASMDER
jgi:hypothetical protein